MENVPFRFEDEAQAEERRARYQDRFARSQQVARSWLHTPAPVRKDRSYGGMVIMFHARDLSTMRKLMDRMDSKGFRYRQEQQDKTFVLEIDPYDFDRILSQL
jgi:hypothetical protein